jgi:hypothetical protein
VDGSHCAEHGRCANIQRGVGAIGQNIACVPIFIVGWWMTVI